MKKANTSLKCHRYITEAKGTTAVQSPATRLTHKGKKCKQMTKIQDNLRVEDCAIRTNADSRAGGPCAGGNKHFVYSVDNGTSKCSCCTADPTNSANVEAGTLAVENIYAAAGAKAFEAACAVKMPLKGVQWATFETTASRKLECAKATWEVQGTKLKTKTFTPGTNEYITRIIGDKRTRGGNYAKVDGTDGIA